MDINKIIEYYNISTSEGIVLSYQGPFLQEIIEEISSVMDKRLTSYSKFKINSRYLTLFIELAQNILHYSKRVDSEAGGIIVTGFENSKIFIISGNIIEENHEIILKEKLALLENRTNEELNDMFKKQLRSRETSERSKGAGLGLIDIIRKSDKIDYTFTTLKSGETFYSIKVEYDSQGKSFQTSIIE